MECLDSNCEERSLEEINTVLYYAKLDPSELRPCVQTIYFSEHLDNHAVKLLELDVDVMNTLEAGDRVVFRGAKEDMAVLCTQTQTFDVKGAELSNSMLLLEQLCYASDLPDTGPQQICNQQVSCVLHEYFELRPTKPKLRKLRLLLDENQYCGRECEEDELHQGKKYTLDDFLNEVQASEAEINAGLEKFKAVQLNGFWRVLDFDHLSTVLGHLIQLAEERDWIHTGVPLPECLEVLENLFPREVIEHVLKCYSSSHPNDMDQGLGIYKFSEDKICQFYAEVCLRNAGKFNLNEFLQVWEQSVPLGMKTNLAQIQGIALVDRDCKPETITYYPVEDLPEDVSERFDYLFEIKRKWTLNDITPYITDLTTDKLDVGALLTKYARASMWNGTKVFSSRKTAL